MASSGNLDISSTYTYQNFTFSIAVSNSTVTITMNGDSQTATVDGEVKAWHVEIDETTLIAEVYLVINGEDTPVSATLVDVSIPSRNQYLGPYMSGVVWGEDVHIGSAPVPTVVAITSYGDTVYFAILSPETAGMYLNLANGGGAAGGNYFSNHYSTFGRTSASWTISIPENSFNPNGLTPSNNVLGGSFQLSKKTYTQYIPVQWNSDYHSEPY